MKMKKIAAVALFLLALSAIAVLAADSNATLIQKAEVDGKAIEFEAVNISGYNYIKAIDFARMLDIDISYNAKNNTTYYDKTKPFTGLKLIDEDAGETLDIDDEAELQEDGLLTEEPDATPAPTPTPTPAVVRDYSNLVNLTQMTWSFVYDNKGKSSVAEKLESGFTFEFSNASTKNAVDFELIDYQGEYKAIDSVKITNDIISFKLGESEADAVSLLKDLDEAANLDYNTRIHDNTKARIESLGNIVKVYINGELAVGELSRSTVTNSSEYGFIFNRSYALGEIKTLRLEVGGKQSEEAE
ncbi:MAG: hypothetical protein LBU32_19200 [Clostridiales bacterium]|jgi:hypothetical protein|nr:hypothetical protein [Clostridiales bacterium]